MSLPAVNQSTVVPRGRFKTWMKRLGVLFLVWLGYRAVVLFAPSRRPILGPKTTVVNGPLLPDGRVDYATFLNERASQGVTPENNAFLHLMETCPPAAIPEKHRDQLCKWLKVSELPQAKQPYVGISEYGQPIDQRNREEYEAKQLLWQGTDEIPPAPPEAEPLIENPDAELSLAEGSEAVTLPVDSDLPVEFEWQETAAATDPWTREKYPDVAAWVELNQPTVDAWGRASRCERFFDPILVEAGFPIALADSSLSFEVFRCRSVLVCNGFLHLGEGNIQAALDIAMTLRRIGRLMKSQGVRESVHYMVGIQLEGSAWYLEKAAIEQGDFGVELVEYLQSQLEQLPPNRPVHQFLEDVVRYERLDALSSVFTEAPMWLREMETFAPRQMDVNVLMEMMNDNLDKAHQILQSDEPPETKSEKYHQLWEFNFNPIQVAWAWAILPRGAATKTATSIYWGRFAPILAVAADFDIQQSIRLQVVMVASDIRKYQIQHGQPPASLSELKSVRSILTDPVTKQPLNYRVEPDGGWVLYSFGLNGKDDGGNVDLSSRPEKDDITIRCSQKARAKLSHRES